MTVGALVALLRYSHLFGARDEVLAVVRGVGELRGVRLNSQIESNQRDGMLTVSDLMGLKLGKPWLAYLSAHDTTKGDAKQPDQVMHLAAAMLFAGSKSVVATMWVMSDEDGRAVAEWFYEELMSNETIDADAVAYALDRAVQKLREKVPSPKRWAQFIYLGA